MMIREVKREEGEEFQKANDLDFFFEVSAKNNHLIDEVISTPNTDINNIAKTLEYF